jgi:hypothetical protein
MGIPFPPPMIQECYSLQALEHDGTAGQYTQDQGRMERAAG